MGGDPTRGSSSSSARQEPASPHAPIAQPPPPPNAAEPFKSAADIAAMLPRQLVEPVQWETTLRKLVRHRRRHGLWALHAVTRHCLRPLPAILPFNRWPLARTSCTSWGQGNRSRR